MKTFIITISAWICLASAMQAPVFPNGPTVAENPDPRFDGQTQDKLKEIINYPGTLPKDVLVQMKGAFDQFRVTHPDSVQVPTSGLSPVDKVVVAYKFGCFVRNVEFIVEYLKLYHAGVITWLSALNEYAAMDHDVFVRTMNGFKELPMTYKLPNPTWGMYMTNNPEDDDPVVSAPGPGGAQDDGVFISSALVKDGLPPKINWTERGVVTSVKNQKQCGACYAFAAIGALEGAYLIKEWNAGRKVKITQCSEQQIIDCSTISGNSGCDSGAIDRVYVYATKNGVTTTEIYPYVGTNGTCKARRPPVVFVLNYVRIPKGNESELKKAVSRGPVACAIDASLQSFMIYSEAIYDDTKCSNTTLNHGVVVVGYGTEKGKDFWICKNSWGTSWGAGGYIRIARNRGNRCGIASSCGYPVLK